MDYLVMRQRVSAGSDFDGTAPTGAAVKANDIYTYPLETAGGLFAPHSLETFTPTRAPFELVNLHLVLGAPNSWSVDIVDPDGNEVEAFSEAAAGEGSFWAGPDEALYIPVGWTVKVVTSAAKTLQVATLIMRR